MSKELPLVSIIIPVYNVEKYLRETLDSVVRQTYANLEIILIDDGSTDSSLVICNEYAQKDNRVIVKSIENGGAAVARNKGLDIATGEYIVFVDSDDLCPEDSVEKMYISAMESNVSLVVGICQMAYESDDGLDYEEPPKRKREVVSGNELMRMTLIGATSACVRLYERHLWDNRRFPEGEINEDEYALLRLYNDCEKVLMLDEVVYIYRKRRNSVTTSDFSEKKLVMYTNAVKNELFIQKEQPQLINEARYKVIKSLLYCLIQMYRKKRTPGEKEACKELRKDLRAYRRQGYLSNPLLPPLYKLLGVLFV